MPNEIIRQEKEKFEALFQHASMGILVAGANAQIQMVNHFLLKQFGYENEYELIGKKIDALIPSRYHAQHQHHQHNYNKNPQPRPMGVGKDLYAVKKDGSEFPVEISLSNYSMGNESFTIAFISDISIRKEFENTVQQHQHKLNETNKKIEELNNELEQKVESRTKELQAALAALETSKDELTKALSKEKELSDLKSRFVSMASHEFRTPLSTILSSASLVAKYTEAEQQENRTKHILRIKSSVNNLTNLLNEFLSIGKIEDGKITANYFEFNLKEMLAVLSNEMEAIAKNEQQIKFIYTGDEHVISDPSLLRNVVTNLLS
ncbi:MAG TPA: PAS domain S-box protein, partial [Ferruginibacter sp.]|nr:PAS domain S-box protein [Ferruginibacter sp.]